MDVRGDVTLAIADPPINSDPPLFVQTQAAVNWLKWGQAPGICSIHAGLLKTGGNAVIMFYALPGTQASSQLTGRGTLLSLSGKGRVIARTAITAALSAGDAGCYSGVTLLSVPDKAFSRIFIDRVCHHVLSISAQSSQTLHQRG